MITFSDHYKLQKSQSELDFVNVTLHLDMPLFIDPLPLSQRVDPWSKECHATLMRFFQELIDCIRSGREELAKQMLRHLKEPNETRFGYSEGKPQGAGIGRLQAGMIFSALQASTAVKTGFISSLEECELMIEGIGRDKISDLSTNILRGNLADYTARQCDLHGIATSDVPMPPCFDVNLMQWTSKYLRLPVVKGKPVLLVPKAIVRFDPAYEHQRYYRHYVLNYLQTEALEAGSSLVMVLKNKRKVVYKKDLSEKNPCTKEFLYEFSRKHKKVLDAYRSDLQKQARQDKRSDVDSDDERMIAAVLKEGLRKIPPGNDCASQYHALMVGIVEFVFYPLLTNPTKEKEIDQGRKRIDILMDNAARGGAFHWLHEVAKIFCMYIPIECKNYKTEVSNPELDQLSGRFAVHRGLFGMLCCRHFEDRAKFVERCRDTWKAKKELIVPIEDEAVMEFLDLIENDKREKIDDEIMRLFSEVMAA